jgi:hypothetical protein
MTPHPSRSSPLTAALALLVGALLMPIPVQAQNISQTGTSGAYGVTLKVLPAESFTGANAEMVRDAGADPNDVNGPAKPNHHLVAFVTKDGKPVEDATVAISYRQAPAPPGGVSKAGDWTTLGVVRMHVAGKGPETTHYGNNVHLAAGSYDVRVSVNGSAPATFRISM